jgi:hypothetical protein
MEKTEKILENASLFMLMVLIGTFLFRYLSSTLLEVQINIIGEIFILIVSVIWAAIGMFGDQFLKKMKANKKRGVRKGQNINKTE